MSGPKTLQAVPARSSDAVSDAPWVLTLDALYPGQASSTLGSVTVASTAALDNKERRTDSFRNPMVTEHDEK